jgi:hypothetical protein
MLLWRIKITMKPDLMKSAYFGIEIYAQMSPKLDQRFGRSFNLTLMQSGQHLFQ